MMCVFRGVVFLLAVVCGTHLTLVSPAAAHSDIMSGHMEPPYSVWPTVPDESKTLVDFADERRPPPLTVDEMLMLQPDTDSLLTPDTDSLLTPDTDSLLKHNVDDLLEPDMTRLGEPGVDGWPQADTGALLREDRVTAGRVAEACHRLLQYYRRHVTQMNFDAVVGTRIAEAHFRMVVRSLEEGDMREGVQSLLQEAEDVNNGAQLVIMETDTDYYHRLGAILEAGFWEAPLTTRSLNDTRLSPPHDPRPVLSGEEQLEEGQSDECLEEVLGGGPGGAADWRSGSEGRGGGRCTVSRVCWQRMTAPGYCGYSLTHQGFIFIVGIQSGCGLQLEQLLAATGVGRSLEGHLRKLCAAVLVEAVAIAQADFPESRRDLFMEQGAFCGLLGYRDFFRRDWVARVLSWQRGLGCFGDTLAYSGHHPLPLDSHPRVRREERPMGGRCLAHRSSVALGYLSVCLRLLTLV